VRAPRSFCSACLARWLAQKPTCPVCVGALVRPVPLRTTREVIERLLPVRCPHCSRKRARGEDAPPACAWTGVLYTLAAHEAACPQRPEPCAHCAAACTAATLQAHLLLCPLAPTPCPNARCAEMPLRRDVSTHRLVCPMEIVVCAIYCCGTLCTRAALGAHMLAAQGTRVELLRVQVLTLTARAVAAEAAQSRLQSEVAQLSARVAAPPALPALPAPRVPAAAAAPVPAAVAARTAAPPAVRRSGAPFGGLAVLDFKGLEKTEDSFEDEFRCTGEDTGDDTGAT
jgi:hypothetical protein